MLLKLKRKDLLRMSEDDNYDSTSTVTRTWCRACGALVGYHCIKGDNTEKYPHGGDCWVAKALKIPREVRTIRR